uniref:Histone deacetylase complex, SIN3 component n=1 Tax=Solanum tuberosum TaxID=4113 RepID=M1A6G3_SOLTU
MERDGLTACATSFIQRLQLHPRIFGQFQRVMKDYSTDKLNVADLVFELDTLFQFHPHFLTAYRIFLPPHLRPTLPSPPQSPKMNLRPSLTVLKPYIAFMNKVQKRFADERGVIHEYLDTIRKLTQGKLCNKEAYNAIMIIFGKENQDLIDEFEFLLLGRNGIIKEKKKKNTMEDKKKNSMEDEMFELDMNLSRRKTAEDSAKELMYSLQQHHEDQLINIDIYFSAVSLGYIRKIYKEEGSSIITRLRDDPTTVLPKILKKLESEEKVLIKKWRDIHQKKKNPCKLSIV